MKSLEKFTSIKRFGFGQNWLNFSNSINDVRINEAIISIQKMLNCNDLKGKTFLDMGCGSGLFSLAACMLGAKVISIDYDSNSVLCTKNLKSQYFPDDPSWSILEGSVLDRKFLLNLGEFDIVYSWGVLHHTGDMRKALKNISLNVKRGGLLFIAIYNKQEFLSKYWLMVKKIYNKSPLFIKFSMSIFFYIFYIVILAIADFIRGRNIAKRHKGKGRRGMSTYFDVVDWIGGYPFETAKPEEIFNYYRSKGFFLEKLTTCGGNHGCNQYVFRNSLNGK